METLTPEQIADLESKIAQLPIIQKHDEDIIEIKDDLEGLKEGQAELKEEMREGFGKGKATMGKHSEQIEALDTKVDEMAKGLKEEIKELGGNIIKKIDEKEMGELKAEIRTLKKKDEKDEAKKWDLAKIFLASAVTAVVAYVVFLLKGP